MCREPGRTARNCKCSFQVWRKYVKKNKTKKHHLEAENTADEEQHDEDQAHVAEGGNLLFVGEVIRLQKTCRDFALGKKSSRGSCGCINMWNENRDIKFDKKHKEVINPAAKCSWLLSQEESTRGFLPVAAGNPVWCLGRPQCWQQPGCWEQSQIFGSRRMGWSKRHAAETEKCILGIYYRPVSSGRAELFNQCCGRKSDLELGRREITRCLR